MDFFSESARRPRVEKKNVEEFYVRESEEKPENFGMYLCLHVCMCVVQIIPLSYVIVLLC